MGSENQLDKGTIIAEISAIKLWKRCGDAARAVVREDICQECRRGCKLFSCRKAIYKWFRCFSCQWQSYAGLN